MGEDCSWGGVRVLGLVLGKKGDAAGVRCTAGGTRSVSGKARVELVYLAEPREKEKRASLPFLFISLEIHDMRDSRMP